jgi:hypothetical protein
MSSLVPEQKYVLYVSNGTVTREMDDGAVELSDPHAKPLERPKITSEPRHPILDPTRPAHDANQLILVLLAVQRGLLPRLIRRIENHMGPNGNFHRLPEVASPSDTVGHS